MPGWKTHSFALTPGGARRLAGSEAADTALEEMARGAKRGIVCKQCGTSVRELLMLGPWVQCMERPRYLPYVVRGEVALSQEEAGPVTPDAGWAAVLFEMVMLQLALEMSVLTMGLGQRIFKER